MAAIAGVLRFDGEGNVPGDVRRVMAQMVHRAPDGSVFFDGDGIGLAHGALQTTPESVHERQPIRAGERWVLLVDGRIDDRGSLMRALAIDPAGSELLGDAELFARAWLRWGKEFWQRVTGDFALAAWDRCERRLTLVRDRIGVRPVFYVRKPRLFAFASEPEALFGLAGVSRECNESAMAALLVSAFGREDMGATLYRDVRRLMPGEALHVSANGEMDVSPYWRMQPGQTLRLRDAREYIDAFREVFGEAVRCRLRALHRPSLMLSGGIDSAGIFAAALPRQAGKGGLLPVSIVADEGDADPETANILRMHGLVDGVRLPVPSFSGCVGLDELRLEAWSRAHPVDNSLLLPRLVCMAARKAGSNVVLDGIDGDIVMRTSDHHAGALALAGHPQRGWREARLASRNNTYLRGESPLRIFTNGIAGVLEPGWMSAWRYRMQDGKRGDETLEGVINVELAKRLRLRERMLALAISERRRRARSSHAEDLIHVWWSPGFIRGMEGYDRTAANFGVESRHPWCDQRVVEFFLNLPVEWKVRDGWIKWIARAAYAAELGDDLVWHTGKDHLGYRVSLALLDASSAEVWDLLKDAVDSLRSLVNPTTLARLLSAWPPGPRAMSDHDRGVAIEIATLAAWIRRYGLQVG